MTTAEFKKIIEQDNDYYSNDTSMHRCLEDLQDAFYGELKVVSHIRSWYGESAIVELDDGKVQLDSRVSACVGAYYFHIEATHTYSK